MYCIIGCTTDSTDDESIFPTPPIISVDEKETTTPDIQIEGVNQPVPEPIVEAVEEPEAEPKDNTPPRFVSSTVGDGSVGVDPDLDRFIFTFDEDIAGTNFIKLIDNTTGLHMGWMPFIRNKKIEILKMDNGLDLRAGHVYTIVIRVADAAHNWTQPITITFVTQFINFAAEEQAIHDLYAVYTVAHGNKDVDTLANLWLQSEERTVFTAWAFWAGTFERNEGWKAVTAGWDGIFRLRGGKVEVDITYISIDSQGKEGVLRGEYKWGNEKGRLISALMKDGKNWKIRAIDYTNGKFGEQIKTLIAPVHIFEKIAKTSFKNDIQPILAERCVIPGCHAAPGVGGLDLTLYNTFKKGGNGGAAFNAGKGKGSLVVRRIDGGGMPPIPPPLKAEQVQLFIDWIDEGAVNN